MVLKSCLKGRKSMPSAGSLPRCLQQLGLGRTKPGAGKFRPPKWMAGIQPLELAVFHQQKTIIQTLNLDSNLSPPTWDMVL